MDSAHSCSCPSSAREVASGWWWLRLPEQEAHGSWGSVGSLMCMSMVSPERMKLGNHVKVWLVDWIWNEFSSVQGPVHLRAAEKELVVVALVSGPDPTSFCHEIKRWMWKDKDQNQSMLMNRHSILISETFTVEVEYLIKVYIQWSLSALSVRQAQCSMECWMVWFVFLLFCQPED